MSVRSELDRPTLHSSASGLVAPSFPGISKPLSSTTGAWGGELHESEYVSVRVCGPSAAVPDRAVVDAARHAVLDGLRADHHRGPSGDSARRTRGVVCILQSADPAISVEELRCALVGPGRADGVAGNAVGLVVVGDDARTAAIEIRRFGEVARALGGYVVGTGLFVDKMRTATDRCPVGAWLRDTTLASSLSLLGRRVEVLAAAGRSLRSR